MPEETGKFLTEFLRLPARLRLSYLRGLKKVIRWAGLPEELNYHSQRRFSITTSAKDENGGLLFAQQQAGPYGHEDDDDLRYVRQRLPTGAA